MGKSSWIKDFFCGLRYLRFECPQCHYIVEISELRRVFGLNMPRSHYLKCPECGKRAWMKAVQSDEEMEETKTIKAYQEG